MNTRVIFALFLLVVSSSLVGASTNDAVRSVQQGLFEEEANHQLEAAIRNYQEALENVNSNRQVVATAIFRLGECYRKEGKTAQALAQYQRILREFKDQTELALLSRQLVGNQMHPPPTYILSFGNSSSDPTDNLHFPGGVAVDAAGNVYVSDTHNNRIQKFTSRGAYLSKWGTRGTNAGCFDYPQGLATDNSGNVYVADTHNNRVQKFTATGAFLNQWGELGSGVGEFDSPYSVAVDSAGNVYVADAHNDRIQKFNSDGAYLSEFGSTGAEAGQLDQPKSVAIDLGGNIYVADADGNSHNNRVQLFASDGTILSQWGSLGSGPGQFNFAARVAVDRTGLKIYVCDASNDRVQLFGYSGE